MSKPKKTYDKKILIRGIEYDRDRFKPSALDEGELPGILDALADISAFANEHCDYEVEPLVNSSPLLHIEGLLRYQITIIDDDLGLTLKQLETTSDFLHEKEYVHNHVSNPKAVFLFDFLSDIVFYSDYPALITHHPDALDKIALNLRALSFLVESQVTGGEKNKDIAFEAFAKGVWQIIRKNQTEAQRLKKITAQQFWDKAVAILKENHNEVDFPLTLKSPFGTSVTYTCVIGLEEKAGKQSIKSTCSCGAKNIPGGRLKGFGQIKNRWGDLRKELMNQER